MAAARCAALERAATLLGLQDLWGIAARRGVVEVAVPIGGGAGLGVAAEDLREAFEELVFVAGAAGERLACLLVELEAAGGSVPAGVRREVESQSLRLRSWFGDVSAESAGLAAAAGSVSDVGLLGWLAGERAALAELVRAKLGLVGAVVAASDWQSPSFGHSLRSAAGRQEGLIRAHWTDYKRDRHLDAAVYERAYVREFVGGGARALMTSCGMSALTTILGFLLCEGGLAERYVVIGRGLYHESKQLLYGLVPARVIEVDERDPPAFGYAIERFEPGVVFVDSLSNTSAAAVVDVGWLMGLLAEWGRGVRLIVDATGTTVAGLASLWPPPEGVAVTLFESLLKYCQFGFDRASAGMVVAWGEDADRLSCHREHLGSNVPDTTVFALPPPNRQLLFRRLARLQRNAGILASRLERAVAEAGRSPVCEVVSPLLASHPCRSVAAGLPFAGSCVNLRLASGVDVAESWERLVEEALAAARRHGASLIAGSSFGFDTTRIYLAAEGAAYGEPFIRIAAGAEHRLAVDELAEALAEAIVTVGER